MSPPLFTRKRFDLADLRECLLDESAGGPFPTDVLFELFRWAIRATDDPPAWKKKNPGHPLYEGIFKDLGSRPFAADWNTDLRKRLRSIFTRERFESAPVTRWRTDHGLDKAVKVLPMLTYEWSTVSDTLGRIFALVHPGRRLKHAYNTTYLDARHVSSIKLFLGASGWVFSLSYDLDRSSWTDDHSEHPLAHGKKKSALPALRVAQKEGEPFVDFVTRAYQHYANEVLTGPCDSKRTPRARTGTCSGWTGRIKQSILLPISPEVIGGVALDAYARTLDYDAIGYSPVLFALDAPVAEVTRDPKAGTFTITRWREGRSNCAGYRRLDVPQLKDERAMLRARARFLLYADWTKRAFLDLPKAEQIRAVNEIHVSKDAPAKVERALALASMKVAERKERPVAWHDAFHLRCHGATCEP